MRLLIKEPAWPYKHKHVSLFFQCNISPVHSTWRLPLCVLSCGVDFCFAWCCLLYNTMVRSTRYMWKTMHQYATHYLHYVCLCHFCTMNGVRLGWNWNRACKLLYLARHMRVPATLLRPRTVPECQMDFCDVPPKNKHPWICSHSCLFQSFL